MKNKWTLGLLVIAFSLTLTACNKDKDITIQTNEDYFTDERIDWYSSDDWGSSIDGSQIQVGEYLINDTIVQLADSKAAPGSLDQIFYNKRGYLENYRLSADFTIDAMPVQEGTFNKMGFYAAYQDNQNYVWLFIHPLETEQFLSVSTMVNGSWEQIWTIVPLPKGIDATVTNNLEVVKVDNEFRIYFNQDLVGMFLADIDASQFGLMSEEVLFTASNIVFEEIDSFDRNTSGLGDSPDSAIAMSGDYDMVMNDIICYGDETVSSAFLEDVLLNDYVIQASLTYTTLRTDATFGFYTSYIDEDNHNLVYYVPEDNRLIVTTIASGVETQDEYDLSVIGLDDVSKLQVFKLDNLAKVYINDVFVAEFAAPNLETSFGLISQNVDVRYRDVEVQDITSFPNELWGGSFDGVIPLRGLYQAIDDDIAILSTVGGAYGSLETVFYRGNDAVSEFAVSSFMRIPDTIELTSTNKYGYLLYNSPEYYLEIFVIPELNAIYTVGKANGEILWANEGFWHLAHTFEEGTDFISGVQVDVQKIDATFTVFVNDEQAFQLQLNAFATLPMQMAFTAENTAPVYFDDFSFSPLSAEDIGPVITETSEPTSFEQGATLPDFTTYVTIEDNLDGVIPVTVEMVDVSQLDLNTVGSYPVTFMVTDSDGNTSSLVIQITVTAPATIYWGDSYDDLIVSNDLFTSTETQVTIVSTNNGGYGEMEQVFYNGIDPMSSFTANGDMRIDDSVVIDVNSKYGFLLYFNPQNYLELFIIPELNVIYTVSKVNDVFVDLWVMQYTFEANTDFTEFVNLRVEKVDGDISVYVNDTFAFDLTIAEFATYEMQVALVGEKTAPIYMEQFLYQSLDDDGIAPTFDLIPDLTIEAQPDEIDFTTYVQNATDPDGGQLMLSVRDNGVLSDTIGSYNVTVVVTDRFGNETTQVVNVDIVDTTGPSFDPIGTMEIHSGGADIDFSTYIENVTDNATGTITLDEVSDTVDYDVPGTYSVTVRATDAAGNQTDETFDVVVIDNPAPLLTLVGLETLFENGSAVPDFTLYVEAMDAQDGSITITSEMIDTTTVDMDTIGTFDVVYTVIDNDLNESELTITFTIQDLWGDSYDGLIASNNQFAASGDDITITNTLLGGYGSMEQAYFNGSAPQIEFSAGADIRIDDSVVVDVNTKYGFILYNDLNNYVEIYLILDLDGIYTVSKVGGAWERLWTLEHTFNGSIDFTEFHRYDVVKTGANITFYVDDVLVFTYTQPAYQTLAMQVGIIGEKTAPVYFEQFSME